MFLFIVPCYTSAYRVGGDGWCIGLRLGAPSVARWVVECVRGFPGRKTLTARHPWRVRRYARLVKGGMFFRFQLEMCVLNADKRLDGGVCWHFFAHF